MLIQENPLKGNVEGNYRHIACLNLTWKVVTGIIAENLLWTSRTTKPFSNKRKGCKHWSQEIKDQLLVNKTALSIKKMRKMNLNVSWIDSKKAYDMDFLNEWSSHYALSDLLTTP